MAYKTLVAKSCANRAALLSELHTMLTSIGWSLVDGAITERTVAYTAVSIANDTFTFSSHGFTDGTPVQLKTTGGAPGALAVLTLYFITAATTDTFKLSTTYNGSAVNITSQGSGNHTIAEAFRVYSSTGEDGDKIAECIQFRYYASATVIITQAFYAWSLTTHAGLGASGATDSLTTSESGCYLWVYGSKNTVMTVVKTGSTYTLIFFGHLKSFLSSAVATALTAAATAGSMVSISVTSTEGFEAGYGYQIVGNESEGRDDVIVSSVTDATTLVITTLARNYAAGALIGAQPSTFGNSYTLYFSMTCPKGVSGTAASNNTYGVSNYSALLGIVGCDPDNRTQKFILFTRVYSEETWYSTGQAALGSYMEDYILGCGTIGLAIEDTLGVTTRSAGTSTGSNDSTTLNDTGKSWTTNAYANKVIIITLGTGVGQIKKIASNTATALTLASGYTFDTVPNATSQYVICDEGYRYFMESTAYVAVREGV